MLRRTLREFNQSPSKIKNLAAGNGAVILTNRGKPEFILLTVEEFETLTNKKMESEVKFSDMVAMQDDGDIDFAPERYSFKFRDVSL